MFLIFEKCHEFFDIVVLRDTYCEGFTVYRNFIRNLTGAESKSREDGRMANRARVPACQASSPKAMPGTKVFADNSKLAESLQLRRETHTPSSTSYSIRVRGISLCPGDASFCRTWVSQDQI